MYVRLTVKLAEVVEGVDLSGHSEGDVIDLPDSHANLLIMGGWAERVSADRLASTPAWPPMIAADRRRDIRRRP
jgi:hypothetical protein